jgi:hypothetical protein
MLAMNLNDNSYFPIKSFRGSLTTVLAVFFTIAEGVGFDVAADDDVDLVTGVDVIDPVKSKVDIF